MRWRRQRAQHARSWRVLVAVNLLQAHSRVPAWDARLVQRAASADAWPVVRDSLRAVASGFVMTFPPLLVSVLLEHLRAR